MKDNNTKMSTFNKVDIKELERCIMQSLSAVVGEKVGTSRDAGSKVPFDLNGEDFAASMFAQAGTESMDELVANLAATFDRDQLTNLATKANQMHNDPNQMLEIMLCGTLDFLPFKTKEAQQAFARLIIDKLSDGQGFDSMNLMLSKLLGPEGVLTKVAQGEDIFDCLGKLGFTNEDLAIFKR